MAGPYREKIFAVAAVVEAVSGVDQVPTAALNAIKVVGIPELEWDFLESGERPDVQSGRLGSEDPVPPAGRWGRVTLKCEIKGGGAAGVAPDYDPLMQASGHSKTVSAGVSVLYTTIDTAIPTATVYLWSAGKLFKLVGCVSTLSTAAEATKRGYKTFTVTGVMAADPVEQAVPGTLALSTVAPPLFIAANSSIGAWTPATVGDPQVLKSVSLDEQVEITERSSAGAADGIVGYLITNRAPRQQMVVEVPALATYDPFAAAKAGGAAGPLTTWQVGTVVGNRLKVQTGRWRAKPKIGAQSSINVMTLDGVLGLGSAPTTNREVNYLYD